MTARRLALIGFVAVTALLVGACGSGGRTVTVTHGPVTLAYVDLGDTGPSVGDVRVAGASGWCESFHLTDGTWRHVLHLGS